jgi:plasmid stabilization system protein ParE
MGATVAITSQAWQDLSEIIDYIAKDNPSAAEQLSERLLESALSLGKAPLVGCRIKGFPGVRMTVYGRYLIIYKVDPVQKNCWSCGSGIQYAILENCGLPYKSGHFFSVFAHSR